LVLLMFEGCMFESRRSTPPSMARQKTHGSVQPFRGGVPRHSVVRFPYSRCIPLHVSQSQLTLLQRTFLTGAVGGARGPSPVDPTPNRPRPSSPPPARPRSSVRWLSP
jgi:hypothetical protein